MKKSEKIKEQIGCKDTCYWSTGMCPKVETCPVTRKKEGFVYYTIGIMLYLIPLIIIILFFLIILS